MSSFLLCLRIEGLRRSSTTYKWSFFSAKLQTSSSPIKQSKIQTQVLYFMFQHTTHSIKAEEPLKWMLSLRQCCVCWRKKKDLVVCGLFQLWWPDMLTGQGRPQGSYWGPSVPSQSGYGWDVEKTQRGPQFSCSSSIWTSVILKRDWMRSDWGRGQ